ncbi:hypothetical protein PF008_g4324 [Phytophthora fragariae]|uniref:Uncharacterized protein n=1 Tax=Phytophthora fragariae TaxID=53985 RepID=A0A6G0SBX1_9STRA|nr:hypothetical protein PF008_g4324 [Phytophthora fragariae]
MTADVGLPTATTDVGDERLEVKLDIGARYFVAGTDWMMRSDNLNQLPHVAVVEDIGVFRHCHLVLYDAIEVLSCIIDGCTDDGMLRVGFMSRHKTSLDFERNAVRYRKKEVLAVIPFRTGGGHGGARVAAVKRTWRV